MDRLEEMLRMQEVLQEKYSGVAPKDLNATQRIDYIRVMMLALENELHEALRETTWKPWSASVHLRQVNRQQFKEELVDAWHFFMNLLLVMNISADEFFNEYLRKNNINHEREDNGYVSPTG